METCGKQEYVIITPIPYVNNILKDSLAYSKYVIHNKTKLATLRRVFTCIWNLFVNQPDKHNTSLFIFCFRSCSPHKMFSTTFF